MDADRIRQERPHLEVRVENTSYGLQPCILQSNYAFVDMDGGIGTALAEGTYVLVPLADLLDDTGIRYCECRRGLAAKAPSMSDSLSHSCPTCGTPLRQNGKSLLVGAALIPPLPWYRRLFLAAIRAFHDEGSE